MIGCTRLEPYDRALIHCKVDVHIGALLAKARPTSSDVELHQRILIVSLKSAGPERDRKAVERSQPGKDSEVDLQSVLDTRL